MRCADFADRSDGYHVVHAANGGLSGEARVRWNSWMRRMRYDAVRECSPVLFELSSPVPHCDSELIGPPTTMVLIVRGRGDTASSHVVRRDRQRRQHSRLRSGCTAARADHRCQANSNGQNERRRNATRVCGSGTIDLIRQNLICDSPKLHSLRNATPPYDGRERDASLELHLHANNAPLHTACHAVACGSTMR